MVLSFATKDDFLVELTPEVFDYWYFNIFYSSGLN